MKIKCIYRQFGIHMSLIWKGNNQAAKQTAMDSLLSKDYEESDASFIKKKFKNNTTPHTREIIDSIERRYIRKSDKIKKQAMELVFKQIDESMEYAEWLLDSKRKTTELTKESLSELRQFTDNLLSLAARQGNQGMSSDGAGRGEKSNNKLLIDNVHELSLFKNNRRTGHYFQMFANLDVYALVEFAFRSGADGNPENAETFELIPEPLRYKQGVPRKIIRLTSRIREGKELEPRDYDFILREMDEFSNAFSLDDNQSTISRLKEITGSMSTSGALGLLHMLSPQQRMNFMEYAKEKNSADATKYIKGFTLSGYLTRAQARELLEPEDYDQLLLDMETSKYAGFVKQMKHEVEAARQYLDMPHKSSLAKNLFSLKGLLLYFVIGRSMVIWTATTFLANIKGGGLKDPKVLAALFTGVGGVFAIGNSFTGGAGTRPFAQMNSKQKREGIEMNENDEKMYQLAGDNPELVDFLQTDNNMQALIDSYKTDNPDFDPSKHRNSAPKLSDFIYTDTTKTIKRRGTDENGFDGKSPLDSQSDLDELTRLLFYENPKVRTGEDVNNELKRIENLQHIKQD